MNKKQIQKLYKTIRESNEELDIYLIEKELDHLERDVDFKKVLKYILVVLMGAATGVMISLMFFGFRYLMEMGC